MYFVEIEQDGKIFYLNGRISPSPYRYGRRPWMARATTRPKFWRGKCGFTALVNCLKELTGRPEFSSCPVTVYKMENLSSGLSKTNMVVLGKDDLFAEIQRLTSKSADSKTAIYKLKVGDEFYGSRKCRGGRIWTSAGSLRAFLSFHMKHNTPAFVNASVFEIELADNQIETKSFKEVKALTFYFRSPHVTKKWDSKSRLALMSGLNSGKT